MDEKVVVTWTLASGIASMIHQLAEWRDMSDKQSQVMEEVLKDRHVVIEGEIEDNV